MTLADFILSLQQDERIVISSNMRQTTIKVKKQHENPDAQRHTSQTIWLERKWTTNALGLRLSLDEHEPEGSRLTTELVRMRDELRTETAKGKS